MFLTSLKEQIKLGNIMKDLDVCSLSTVDSGNSELGFVTNFVH